MIDFEHRYSRESGNLEASQKPRVHPLTGPNFTHEARFD